MSENMTFDAAQLREFLTITREFNVYECSVGNMTFKMNPSGQLTRQPETQDERRSRIRKDLEDLAKEEALDETWST